MPIDDKQLTAIRSNADLVIEQLDQTSDISFGTDAASVEWLEGFIERQRIRQNTDVEGLVATLGSYLGEAVIAATGGEWDESDELGLSVLFPNGDRCFPFNKVRKQFEQGVEAGESVSSFYDTAVNYLATGKLAESRDSS